MYDARFLDIDFKTIDNRLVVIADIAEDDLKYLKEEAKPFWDKYDKIYETAAYCYWSQLPADAIKAILDMDVGTFVITHGRKVTKISDNLVVGEFLPIGLEFYHF